MATETLKATIRGDLTAAMKSRDKLTASTLRMALTAITNAEVSGKTARELSDEDVVVVLTKEVKKRAEASAAYRDAGRPDSAELEEAEAAVLRAYLPAQMSVTEVQALIDEAVAQAQAKGMEGGRAMGAVMGAVRPRTTGRFDGGELAALVKQSLAMT